MIKSYKYRIYPTVKQAKLLDEHFAACRIIYNLALEVKLYVYSSQRIFLNKYDLSKQLPELKKEFPWLLKINAQSLQSTLNNLDIAFTSFYQHKTDFPKFKSKRRCRKSCKFPQGNKIVDDKLKIPKFTEGIKIQLDKRTPIGIIKNVIISKSSTNKYYASITYENKEELPKKKSIVDSTTIGIDVGLKHFAVISDGTKIENPKFLRNNLLRLKILQRRLSKKQKSSKRRKSYQYKINLLHEKIVNQRKDFLHKLSNQITNDYDTVCMENLNIGNMMKNHSLAGIGDASWFMFGQFILYKSEWKGKNKLEIGRFEPSSRLCTCGVINRELTLADREWDCKACGRHHDRDIIAANNIKNIALANHLKISGQVLPDVDVELPTLVGAMKRQVQK